MRRAPNFSFIFFNDSIFERLQEEERQQHQQQHEKWERQQEPKLPKNSAGSSFSVAS
jgi:hypothetical protein